MSPMLIDPPVLESTTKSVPVCSDPLVAPSHTASKRVKELWWLHGHPHSKRYSNPDLVSLGALVRHDGVAYRGQTAFLYPTSTNPDTEYKPMTWDDFDAVTETIALSYAYQLQEELREANSTRKQPTIALLGAGKSIEYFCTQLALQKLGLRVLLLAESNPPHALHYLLESCHALAIITDAKNARIDTNGIRKVAMVENLPEGSVAASVEVDKVKFQDFGDVWERHSFIIHSSGSTGMPKPIIHTNRSMMLIARMYRLFQDFAIDNWFLLFPLYHIAGISIALSNLPNGQILSFPPISWPPSSSSIFSAWKTLSDMGHPVQCVHCAPTLIENMYEYITTNGNDFSPLTSLKILQPGGAALSESIIRALVTAGVNIKTTYGSTEIGPPFRTIASRDDPNCYKFRNLYPDNPFLKMEEIGDGIYECVVLKGFELAAELWEESDAPYRTNDIFIQNPAGSGFFTLQGRKDDILVHSNGENTSAGALQLDLQSATKVIHKALALGHSKPCVSILVEVHENYDPNDGAVRDQIWEAVQTVTARYPKHSQIMRSMVCVLPKGSILPVTPKGNVKRKEAERIFAAEIEDLYSDTFPPSPTLSHAEIPLADYIRSLLSEISGTPISEIDDYTTLYDLGITSLTALSLRTSLSKHLSRPVSLSTLFENPTISKLVLALSPNHDISSLTAGAASFQKPSSIDTVNRIISSLTTELSSWPPRPQKIYPSPIGHTILLTGGSGSLGTSLLSTLSSSPHVTKIYALIRGPHASQKLFSSLQFRGLDTSILDIPSPAGGTKIEVLNFSMRDTLLGLDIDTYAMLARDVTIVLAGAWKMNFNVPVEEFEDDCFKNTMSLLRLTHAGRPKTFAFTSSISTCMGFAAFSPSSGLAVPEEAIGDDPAIALGTGYALSKYIVERLTQHASSTLAIPTLLLRVGQLSGHTRTGHWSTSEMWPIMFATSFHPDMRALPVFQGKMVDWIPVDVAAGAITDILLAPRDEGEKKEDEKEEDREERYSVHNIVNPRPIPWSELLGMLQATTSALQPPTPLAEIPMQEWVARLNTLVDTSSTTSNPSSTTTSSNPPVPGLRLLQFFEDMAMPSSSPSSSPSPDLNSGKEEAKAEKGGEKSFETQKTQGISESLRNCEAFNKGWVESNIRVWREGGFWPGE